ncbi:hypothetical protein [Candidatus Vondammii sp. HM_W22]|uniref:hypothetical protein n=1 Tax=Candidatus Vondammii sp. HM_W22 TaxID=2687299 RepID=UPI002E7BA655|nr:hypothetical protein [Candidatus Vondammii sp. HM_W22]
MKQTIELALNTKAMSLRELEDVNVDTTVQEKAITFPTSTIKCVTYWCLRLKREASNDARAMSRWESLDHARTIFSCSADEAFGEADWKTQNALGPSDERHWA